MSVCVSTFAIIVILLLFVSLLMSFGFYKSELPYKYKNCPQIKFSDFKKWYSIAPDSWVCFEYYVNKNYCSPCYFSFFDCLRYRRWRKRRNKRRQEEVANRKLKEILESVQDDIEDFKERIDRENKKARKDIEEIKNKLTS